LKSYIADVATTHPKVRLIGICFGHQIIASALGGECVPNDGTWEIGVTEVNLSPAGKAVFGGDKIVSLLQRVTTGDFTDVPSGNTRIPQGPRPKAPRGIYFVGID